MDIAWLLALLFSTWTKSPIFRSFFGHVWAILNITNLFYRTPEYQMSWVSSFTLKSRQIAAILSKNHLKSGQKRSDFEWSGFQMVGTLAIATAKAIWKPGHLKSDLQKVWISNSRISDPHWSLFFIVSGIHGENFTQIFKHSKLQEIYFIITLVCWKPKVFSI